MKRQRDQHSAPGRCRMGGQGMIEFAALAMILMILLAGIVDLGRALLIKIELSDAAQEGAAYGAIGRDAGETQGAVVERIEQRLRQSANRPLDLLTNPDVSVAINLVDRKANGAWCAGNRVQVTVSYQFTISMPLLGTVLGTQVVPISSTVSDTIITPDCP